MSSSSSRSDSPDTAEPPFLLKTFYKTGALLRPDDFTRHPLPSHVCLHTWRSSTPAHLALDLLAAAPVGSLPDPAVGTRLVFQLVYADTRGGPVPRFVAHDLGSVVLGGGLLDAPPASSLADARFVVGDYLSVAILPPFASGEVAPPAVAYRDMISTTRRSNDFGRSAGRGPLPRDGGAARCRTAFPIGEWRRGDTLPNSPDRRPKGRARW